MGACTAIFSVVKPILIDPLPYPQAGRLMMLWEMRKDGAPLAVTFATFQGMQQRAHALETAAAFKPWQAAATATSQADRPERIDGQRVSADYFACWALRRCIATSAQRTTASMGPML